jgi:N-glycosylase/DNA lyase
MSALAQDGVEETLRKLGFGYRAKYIANTAKAIHTLDHGEEWLMGLRKLSYEEAHNALLTLQGVGPKVADCVVSWDVSGVFLIVLAHRVVRSTDLIQNSSV